MAEYAIKNNELDFDQLEACIAQALREVHERAVWKCANVGERIGSKHGCGVEVGNAILRLKKSNS